jgi:ubiquitin-like 1-activating enzyme E1 B
VEIDPEVATLEHLVGVLQTDLGYSKISLFFGNDLMIYESPLDKVEGEEEDEDDLESERIFSENLGKKFSEFGISHKGVVLVTDDSGEDTRVNLEVLLIER